MSFADLPTELLVAVVKDIYPFDIPKFARTCKYHYKLAEQHLNRHRALSRKYRYASVGSAEDESDSGNGREYYTHPISLITNLLKNPDVAFHIKELRYYERRYLNHPQQEEMALLAEYNQSLRLPDFFDIEWLLPLHSDPVDDINVVFARQSLPDPFLFDLLLLLPSLERLQLHLHGVPIAYSKAVTDALSKAMTPPAVDSKPGPFQKLRRIVFQSDGENLVELNPLHVALTTLPSIESFLGYMVVVVPNQALDPYRPEVTSPAKNVAITSDFMWPRDMLPLFSGLRKLSCDLLRVHLDQYGSGWDLDSLIQTVAECAAETLEELELTQRNRLCYPEYFIQSFHDFPNLRVIDIYIKYILPFRREPDGDPKVILDCVPRLVDILPPSIRRIKLRIERQLPGLKRLIRDFDTLQPERLPHLEDISLWEFSSGQDAKEAMAEKGLKPWLG